MPVQKGRQLVYPLMSVLTGRVPTKVGRGNRQHRPVTPSRAVKDKPEKSMPRHWRCDGINRDNETGPLSSDRNVPSANFNPDNARLKWDRNNADNPYDNSGFRLSVRA